MQTGAGVVQGIVDEHACLIGTIEVSRAADHLVAVVALRGIEDVVPTVALVHVAALEVEVVAFGCPQDDGALVAGCLDLRAFVVQFSDGDVVHAVGDVLAPVVVDEHARVVELLLERIHGVGTFGPTALAHDEAVVLQIDADVEPPVVVAHGRRPAGASVGRLLVGHAVRGQEGERVVGVSDDAPVHQVLGVAHGNARHTGERAGNHVIVAVHADDVHVGIVAARHGVGECAVAVIGGEHLKGLWLCVFTDWLR